jgi:hypothetical protein
LPAPVGRHSEPFVPDHILGDRPQALDAHQLSLDLSRLEPGAGVGDPVVEDVGNVVVAVPDLRHQLLDQLAVGAPDRSDFY